MYVPPDLKRVSAHSLNALARFISDQEYRHASIPMLVYGCVGERSGKDEKSGKRKKERTM